MLTSELTKALNEQMVFELYSAYLYLGLAASLDKLKLPGASKWMRIQADEEILHASMFYDYLNGQDADIELAAIGKPELAVESAPDAFTAALKHEKLVSARINKLAALALAGKDFATLSFLNVFLTEQIEEEHNVQVILDKLSLAGESRQAVLFIDYELAQRGSAAAPGKKA